MLTAKQVKHQISQDPTHLLLHLMSFVDDFRYHQNMDALAEPIPLSEERTDALLASTVEYLCHELQLPASPWIEHVPACKDPWFVSGLENLKALALAQSPLEFRVRKIFVLANFLDRC